MWSSEPQECSFADAQESRIQFVKRSDLGSADMKGIQFAYAQETPFQIAKISDMGCAILLEVSIWRCSEIAFSDCEKFKYGYYSPARGRWLLLRNRVFRVKNIEIWAELYSKKVDFADDRNLVYRLRNVMK